MAASITGRRMSAGRDYPATKASSRGNQPQHRSLWRTRGLGQWRRTGSSCLPPSTAGAVTRLTGVSHSALVFALKEMQGAAGTLGVTLQPQEVRRPQDFAAAFAAIAQERPDALLVLQDAVTMQQRGDITDFAMHERLPSMFQEKGWAQAGGLMSYGEDLAAMYRRAAFYVDRIFKGANPADLPVEQATKFELAINLKTAKAIGLTFPDRILAVADPVIE